MDRYELTAAGKAARQLRAVLQKADEHKGSSMELLTLRQSIRDVAVDLENATRISAKAATEKPA